MTGSSASSDTMTVRLDRRRNSIPIIDPTTGILWTVGKYGVPVSYAADPQFPGWSCAEFADREVIGRLKDAYPGRWPHDLKPRVMSEVREIIDTLNVREITGKTFSKQTVEQDRCLEASCVALALGPDATVARSEVQVA